MILLKQIQRMINIVIFMLKNYMTGHVNIQNPKKSMVIRFQRHITQRSGLL